LSCPITQAAVIRNSSLPRVEHSMTSGYQLFAESRIAGFGLIIRSAIWERACCARRGCSEFAKPAARSASDRGRVNVVIYQSRNGIRTNANVSTRMAMSHFLAIADLGGDLKELAACGMVIIPFHYTLLNITSKVIAH